MSELPPAWVKAVVRDLADPAPRNHCEDNTEVGFIPMSRMGTRHRDKPTFERRKWKEVKKGYTHFADGDVLLSRITPCFENGKAGIPRGLPNGVGAGSTEYVVLRPKAGAAVSEFILALFKTEAFLRDGTQSMTGAVGQQRVPKAVIESYPVNVPPFAEQRRICEKLDSVLARVDACRERLDRVPLILKKFREAVLEAAVSGRLTDEWRLRQSPAAIDSSLDMNTILKSHANVGGHRAGNAAPPTNDVHDLEPSMFPKEWGLISLRDAIEPGRPITYGILKPGPEVSEGVSYVRVADYPGNRLNLATVRKTSRAIEAEFARARLRAGDLLLSIRGTVGRLIVIPRELAGANITQDSARLSIQSCIHRPFVQLYLSSPMAQQRMRRATKGVAVRGINIGDVRALQLPVPAIAEQREISRRVGGLLDFVDSLQRRYQQGAYQAERLTPSVLAKAFRGELVPQDPNDEPAKGMLEAQCASSSKRAHPDDRAASSRPR